MSTWYYAIDGKQLGPVPSETIRSLLESGSLDRSSGLLWKDGMDEWKAPEKIAEFLSVQPNVTSTPAPAFPQPDSAAPAVQEEQTLNPYAAPQTSEMLGGIASNADLQTVKPANFMLMTLTLMAGLIGIFAAVFMVDESTEEMSPTGLSVLLVSLVALTFGGVLSLIYLYRAWTIISRFSHFSTPGRAVGFLFIPFYNLYWIFVAYWRWSQEWNRIVIADPANRGAPRVSEGLFLTYAILNVASIILGALATLPQFVIFFIIMKQMCDAINWAAVSTSAPMAASLDR